MPQLVNDAFVLEPNTCAENKNLNEYDAFILEPNTCAKNKNLLLIAAKKDELKLLYSLDTLGYIEFDTLCALTTLEEKFWFAHLSRSSVYFTLLANIIIKESIWYTEFIFVQI
jgi:hypothetical protein